MTPERVAERVELLIEAIRGGMSDAFAEHNAVQFQELVKAVNEAADAWLPKLNRDGVPLEG
jgi:hypothetical protein